MAIYLNTGGEKRAFTWGPFILFGSLFASIWFLNGFFQIWATTPRVYTKKEKTGKYESFHVQHESSSIEGTRKRRNDL